MEQDNTSEVLLALSCHHDGDLDKIYQSITTREVIKYSELDKRKIEKYFSILDDAYPKYLLEGYKPPITIFYDGDISLIRERDDTLVVLNGNNTSLYATKSLVDIIKGSKTINKVVVLTNTFDLQNLQQIIDSGKKIIMVLPKAIDSKDYKEKYRDIVTLVINNGGLLLTETPYGSLESTKRMYLMRLLALLTSKVLVGGVTKHDSLIQAIAVSMHLDGDIYCIPFPIGSNYINNSLIKEGAFLIEGPDDFYIRNNKPSE